MLVGIDLGTQSIKAVVCDDELVVRGEAATPVPLRTPRPGWAEQDPADWQRALAPTIGRALATAGAKPSEVIGIGVAGQLDGCIAVDDDGYPLAPCLIWMDRRASSDARAVSADRVRAIAGVVADPSHMAAKIRWLSARVPAVQFHQPVSYLVAHLTGNAVLDHGLASTTMLYDLARREWSDELLDGFGVSRHTLPLIADASAIAGRLTHGGSQLTGLPVGTPVAVGTGDDFATPLGAGIAAPGVLVCVVGTAEVVGAIATHPVVDGEAMVETHAYPAGGWFIENPGWVSGGALTWLTEILSAGGPAHLDALAAAVPPGARGLSFLPALTGTMTPEWHPAARGAFYGLSLATDRGAMVRAVLEASAFACRDVSYRLRDLGVAHDRVRLLGGGSQSRLWAQIRADILGLPHEVIAAPSSCAIGAAVCAATAVGRYESLAAASTAVAPSPAWVAHPNPNPAHRAEYDEAYQRYRALFAALRPLFAGREARVTPYKERP